MRRVLGVGVALVLALGMVEATAAGGAVSTPPVTEFVLPAPTRLPQAIATGPDGAMWFVEGGQPKIGRITTTGTVQEFATSLFVGSTPPTGITAGPDGAMWFTAGEVVGRLSPAGALKTFPIPFIAYGITTGPDGALWLAGVTPTPPEIAPPVTVARLSTTGALSVFKSTTAGDALGITTGPDGALWFAENGPDKIGRVTTSGHITEYTIPTPFAFPVAIVAGPDHALWFTEQFVGKIGRITTRGTITEFPLPTSGIGINPEGITAGPDRALWFTEEIGKIGRITTTGVITETPVPTASGVPMGIGSGSDGAVWFTEQVGNRIGRITVAPTVPTKTDQCRHGGWQKLADDHGHPFRNQRQCLRFVRHHQDDLDS